MSYHKEDYANAAKSKWEALSAWGHAHTFLAGLIIGALCGFIAAKAFF